jgi:hypothetical protein
MVEDEGFDSLCFLEDTLEIVGYDVDQRVAGFGSVVHV